MNFERGFVMLPALKAFFTNVSSWLIILKYSGLTLAASSTVWATVNVQTITTPEGRKRITSAAIVAIGLTVLGLLISIVSEDLQRRHAAEVSKEPNAERSQVADSTSRSAARVITGRANFSVSYRRTEITHQE